MKVTKKSRLDAARQIIDRNMIGVPFDAADTAAMNKATGCDWSGYRRQHNPEFPGDLRHVYAQDAAGGWRMFSWVKAINQPSWEQQAKRAMRDTGRELLREFKEAQDLICAECQIECDYGSGPDGATVDETPPLDALIAEYVAAHGWPEMDNPPDVQGWVFKNIDDEARWIAFHQSRVSLRILCRSCNSSKGKHTAPRTTKAERASRNMQPDLFA